METIKFNTTFKVKVEVENDGVEIGEVQKYFTDNRINWTLDFIPITPGDTDHYSAVFTYECTLLTATIIYLSIRSIGQLAIPNDIMNKEYWLRLRNTELEPPHTDGYNPNENH